jgi:hypothetical protein
MSGRIIGASTLDVWARLLAIAAAEFDALADEAAPGSPRYLQLLSLCGRCKAAAEDAADAAEEAFDAAMDAFDANDAAIAKPGATAGTGAAVAAP